MKNPDHHSPVDVIRRAALISEQSQSVRQEIRRVVESSRENRLLAQELRTEIDELVDQLCGPDHERLAMQEQAAQFSPETRGPSSEVDGILSRYAELEKDSQRILSRIQSTSQRVNNFLAQSRSKYPPSDSSRNGHAAPGSDTHQLNS